MKLEADLVIVNANIITMDPQKTQASALAVKSYKLITVGNDEDVADLLPNAKRVMDLGGKTVVPGFIDAHTHLTNTGVRSTQVKLDSVRSVEEAIQELKDTTEQYESGEWIIGWGWDESNWTKKRFLTMKDLDSVSTEHPIAAIRVDGHLISVNSMGLERIGVNLSEEGVGKDSKGQPTGILRDIEGMYEKLRATDAQIQEGVMTGNQIAASLGITTAVDNAPEGYLRQIREVERLHKQSTRMIVNIPISQLKHLVSLGITSAIGTPLTKIGGVKIFTDGSIGAGSASLFEPYKGERENFGMLLMEEKEFSRHVKNAVKNGIQTVTHAIGDKAIEMVISAFEGLAESEKTVVRDQRHRIEHAEMISDTQIRRAVGLGLILSMQPNFVGRWQQENGLYEERLGKERTEKMNNFRLALDNGARLCFGSDGMPLGPLYGIWSATTSTNPDVKLTVEEALRCYTMESAYASFLDRSLGSLQEGKRADFVVLSENILKVPHDSIKDIQVEMTFVGGILEFVASGT
ncbi:MAG: amidohydrolase [Candidatus Thorarchaeota archaeon]|jgi:predicted amidohydrolase YtcJ